MPYPVSNLIEEQGKISTAKREELLSEALSKMIEKDYSQLPVIDNQGHPVGIITYKSILRAIRNFNASLTDLLVKHAMEQHYKFDLEDDVFDLLKVLKDTNAVLITGAENKLIGIVTSYDTTEYFRCRSEDLMKVEEIESLIKELIELKFLKCDGEVDSNELQTAVNNIIDRSDQLKKNYKSALHCYHQISSKNNIDIDNDAYEKSFQKILNKNSQKTFDQLTLGEFIELLLHGESWDFYENIFNVDQIYLRNMLEQVRKTRNHLAHFKGEISSDQRENLNFCSNCLSGVHEEAYKLNESHIEKGDKRPYRKKEIEDDFIAPVGEETTGETSKYAPLGEYLQGIPGREDRIRLSFEEIENIIGDDLPPSAYQHRTWWANDTVGHVQSRHWLDSGWKVGYRNLSSKEVSFSRIKEREKAYIEYFSPLKTKLKEELKLPLKESSASGTHYISLIRVPGSGKQLASIIAAFANGGRYRIEIYIDTGEKEINKAVFDDLKAQQLAIENELGHSLGWERIPEKRASRIALYNKGSIDDNADRLKKLQDWTVHWLPQFYDAIFDRASEALLDNYND